MNIPNSTKSRIIFVALVAVFVIVIAGYWQPPQLVEEVLRTTGEGTIFHVTDLVIANLTESEDHRTLAPDFQLTYAKDSYWLSAFRGGVVVLNFMATRCVFCKLEILQLQDVWERYEEDVVLVSIDVDPTESAETLSAFTQEFSDASWIWALDRSNLALAYGVVFIPATVIIDQEGYVRFTHTGMVAAATLTQEIDQVLTRQGE